MSGRPYHMFASYVDTILLLLGVLVPIILKSQLFIRTIGGNNVAFHEVRIITYSTKHDICGIVML